MIENGKHSSSETPASEPAAEPGAEAQAADADFDNVHDLAEAMALLRREGDYTNAPRPDLIVLDLNLPKKDGREVLAEIKADCHLRQIPVVVLSTSEAEEDIRKSYDLQANCYITKPVDLDRRCAQAGHIKGAAILRGRR